MLIVFLAVSVVSLGVIGFVALIEIRETGDYALKRIAILGDEAVSDSTVLLENIGEQLIVQKASDVARQIEIYISLNRDMTITDLQNDSEFRSIAVQLVGETGYTAVLGLNYGTFYFHKFRDVFENINPERVFMDPDSEFYNPQVWDLINQTVSTHEDSSGYYDWREPNGDIRSKYLAFAIVNGATVDGVEMFVAATTYIDEFSRPVEEIRKEIDAATLHTSEHIERRTKRMRNTFISIFIATLLGVSGLAFILSRTIATPILKLADAARVMEKGEIGEEQIANLSQSKGEDEVASLSRVFASMATKVKARENRLKRQVEELRIGIDEAKKAKEVANITESDYFQRLQEHAKTMRDRRRAE